MRIEQLFVDIVYYLLKGLRYRQDIISRNIDIIRTKYPEHSSSKVLDQYYFHLAGMILETLWAYGASPEDICKKVRLKNPEIMDRIIEKNENTSLLITHIGNWELFCQWTGIYSRNINVVILYTDIKNQGLNYKMKTIRQRFGAHLVSTKSTLDLYRMQKKMKPCINLFAIDQNPGDPFNQEWMHLFGLDVPVISGAEKFIRSQHQDCYFLHVSKSEGIYELELQKIDYDIEQDLDITRQQIEMLERNVSKDPSLWLLSHNRFKHRR